MDSRNTQKKNKRILVFEKGVPQRRVYALTAVPCRLIKRNAERAHKIRSRIGKKSGTASLLFSDPAAKDKLFCETYRSFGAASGLAHGFWEYTKNNGIFGHEGGTYGFQTQLWVQPERERAILIATNVMESDFCRSLMNELVQNEAQAGKETSANANGNAGTNAAGGTDTAKFARFSGEYFPARSVWTHAGKLNGYMQMISIQQNTDGTGKEATEKASRIGQSETTAFIVKKRCRKNSTLLLKPKTETSFP